MAGEKEFQMFEETPEVTPGGDPPPAKKPGEEEESETPPEEGAEGAEPGKKPAEKKEPAAKKPEDEEPPIPPEAAKHLARMRRAHERELKLARLEERNKVLEEVVKGGVKLPAAGDKPAAGQEGDGFVFDKPRPTRDSFEGSETEYEDAVADWRDDRREAKRQYDARQAQAQNAKKKGDELYDKMHTDAITRYPDYDEKVAESVEKGIQVNQQVAQAIQRFGGKYMPDLIYYFATHPEEVNKLNAAEDPFDAVEDLRDTIALEQKQSGKPRSKTPPPPPKLGADTGAGGIDLNDPKLSPDERIGGWKKEREREAAGKKK